MATLSPSPDPPSNPNPPPNSNSNPNPSPNTLLHLSFNQDAACFSAATDLGFLIFNCDPFHLLFRRDFPQSSSSSSSSSAVHMLFRCNILALLGDPFPPNKVLLWDDHQSRCIGELSFRSPVRSARLRRDRIAVVLDHKLSLYNFSDLKLLHQIDTFSNPSGLCDLSQSASKIVLVCPGLHKGQVRIEHYSSKRTKFIMAHDSRIACLALTHDGGLLATASSKGTLVRVFNTYDGSLLQEVLLTIRQILGGLD